METITPAQAKQQLNNILKAVQKRYDKDKESWNLNRHTIMRQVAKSLDRLAEDLKVAD